MKEKKIEKTSEEIREEIAIEQKDIKSRIMGVLTLSICFTLIILLYFWISGNLIILYVVKIFCIIMFYMSILILFQHFPYGGFGKTATGAFISTLFFLLLLVVVSFATAREEEKLNIKHLSITKKIEKIIKEKSKCLR